MDHDKSCGESALHFTSVVFFPKPISPVKHKKHIRQVPIAFQNSSLKFLEAIKKRGSLRSCHRQGDPRETTLLNIYVIFRLGYWNRNRILGENGENIWTSANNSVSILVHHL